MSDQARTMFVVLTMFGTLCILGSLASIGYLYLQTYPQFSLPTTHGEMPRSITFLAYVITPAAAVFVSGVAMVFGGVWAAIKDQGQSPLGLHPPLTPLKSGQPIGVKPWPASLKSSLGTMGFFCCAGGTMRTCDFTCF